MVTNFRWGLTYTGGGDFFQVGVGGVLPTMVLFYILPQESFCADCIAS